MGAIREAEERWTIEDVANYVRRSTSWVYKRTAPNSAYYPKLPRLPNLDHPTFDPLVIKEIFPFGAGPARARSSLKTKEVGKSVLLEAKQKIRQKEKLW